MPLAGHDRVALDSNVLIYLLEDDARFGEIAAGVIDAIEHGDAQGVMASIGLVEILAAPAHSGDAAAFERTAAGLADLSMQIVGLDADLAGDAAWLQGALGLTVGDAIHLATARRAGATAFITNDRRLRSIARLEVLYLDEIA
ncbi:MAG: PIN domain-containing protein [Candidatus Limnocylindrales bacterium]